MKRPLYKIAIFSFLIVMVLTVASCLKGDLMNTPPGAAGATIIMTNNPNGSGLVNSGLFYFAACALTYPAADVADTATFAVSLQGTLGKDLNVSLSADPSALLDNFSSDSITYVAMPDSVFSLVSTSGVIKAGGTYVPFQVVFHPNKVDPTKNFMLALTATNDGNITTSANYGHIYYHTIGNPIAGGYNWNFVRCSTPNCSAGPDGQSFNGKTTIFAPANGTLVKVPTGYFDGALYFITFDNNNGVLSNFKAQIDPASLTGNWAANGIVLVTGPTILVENNNTKFTLNYTTLTRNCTDIYYK